jgi:tripeptidyl-peptidase-1
MLPLLAKHALMAAFLFAAIATGSSPRSRSPYVVKDTHHVPKRWKPVGPAPAEHLIKLQIGLKQAQFSELERHLYEGIFSIEEFILLNS